MRKLLLIAVLLLPSCKGDGPTPPTPITPTPPPLATLAPAPPPPSVPAISGAWDSEARRWHFRIQQQGSTVSGQLLGYRTVYYPDPRHPDLALRGSITPGGVVTFGCNSDGVYFEGRVESATRITGTLYDCVNGCRSYGDVLIRTGN